ncbi:Ferric/cupric reductase transmembrane component 7 [Ceratocystis fimbriata CBS 114723]|uniref:ferric-chelate reductase (NADPH) n=1 Tax=Ceratocystis fimbriata CBS 114723 TaxID=1035309 RepID=A0A2C5XAW6_9PEZI|nr:Ferric/cupric reductase transmembrane component 7 [Ceratocystis fimbriata CBS 114723]
MASLQRPPQPIGAGISSRILPRIQIPLTPDSPPGLIEAHIVDPWGKSGKYGRWWTYFAVSITVCVALVRMWHFWQDRIRRAMYKNEVDEYFQNLYTMDPEYAHVAMATGNTGNTFLNHQHRQFASDHQQTPEDVPIGLQFKPKAHMSNVGWINDIIALFRWTFYRPIPDVRWHKHRISFSSAAVLFCVFLAVLFAMLSVFLQQPLYWESIRYGSPPMAIRAGMLAVAITPWIVATSMKANILTIIIGIGSERLNVFHRWLGYITLLLTLIHTIPFYVQPVWEDGGSEVFSKVINGGSGMVYGTGIACLVPLIWLCVASLPVLRRIAYEVFAMLHAPVAAVYIGLLFWHTKNYLSSWDYLYTSVAIWGFCYFLRIFNLNWSNPWRRLAFLVGDEAAVTLMPENAVKITIPTFMRWKPGQFVYLRMPGISILDNHPFTISSLCSEDFPSEYGPGYRDCVIVFKPYGGFTRRVLEAAIEKGPLHTYRAFLDGPYGGLRRDLSSFETCILIAGGSGITALMSQLLNLIKRMRDGKAITRKVVVVWAIKRLEALDWFREELRICRESAPPEAVTCKFFVTTAKQRAAEGSLVSGAVDRRTEGLATNSQSIHDRLDAFVTGVASKRNSALIDTEAQGQAKFIQDQQQDLRTRNEDEISALPDKSHWQTHDRGADTKDLSDSKSEPAITRQASFHFPVMRDPNPPHFNNIPHTARPAETAVGAEVKQGAEQPIRIPETAHLRTVNLAPTAAATSDLDFGFLESPTELQKSIMRSAFPMPYQMDGGWSVEYGRPDLGYMLKGWAMGGPEGRGILGRRTAVFVCGPPSMREGVASTVAKLQANIWGDDMLDEIFLHTENYAL